MEPQTPPPAGGGTHLGTTLTILASVAALAVAGSQIVLNGFQIKDKVVPPTPAVSAPATKPDPAPVEPSVAPPITEPLPTPAATVPVAIPIGQPLTLPLDPASAALPDPLPAQCHDLFVAMEEAIKHTENYRYQILFLDPTTLRALKKPPKDGGTLELTDTSRGGLRAGGLELDQKQWEALQSPEWKTAAVVLIGCATAPCERPVFEWDTLRDRLEPSGTEALEFRFAGAKRDEPQSAVMAGIPAQLVNLVILVLIPEAPPA
ncbi:MAG: hypothetical protein ABI743_07410 [bacterium]